MPEFPRYFSKGKLDVNLPAVPSPVDSSAKGIEAMGKVGDVLADSSKRWLNATDTTQKLISYNSFAAARDDITTQAKNDPNSDNAQKYYNMLDKAKAKSLEGFSSKLAETEMTTQLNYHARVGQVQIESMYKDKMTHTYQAELLKFADNEVKHPTPASLSNIQTEVNKGLSTGLIFPDDAYKFMDKQNDALGKSRVDNDIFLADTSAQLDAIKTALKSGAYEQGGVTIDGKDKLQMLRSIEVRQRQAVTNENFIARVARQEKTFELMDLANDGLLTPSTLEEAFLTKQIANTTYNSMQKNMESPVGPTADTDKQTYYNLTHMLLDDKTDPEKALTALLDANTAGKLSTEDTKKLYEMHLIPSKAAEGDFQSLSETKGGSDFEKMKAAFDAKVEAVANKRNWFRAAFKSINTYFSSSTSRVTDATQKLVDNVQTKQIKNEDLPAEADKIIGQENLKQHPDWATLPKTGKQGVDRFGNKVTVFPDGRVIKSQ